MIFGSLDAFYEDDPRRRVSGELAFGSWWFDAAQRQYRVSAIKDTGEVYALRLGGFMGREGEVLLLVTGLETGSYDEAERLLNDWPEQCGFPNSLAWVQDRLAGQAS